MLSIKCHIAYTDMDQTCPNHTSVRSLNNWLSLLTMCSQSTEHHHFPTIHLQMSYPMAEVSAGTEEGMKAERINMCLMQQVCFDKEITSFQKNNWVPFCWLNHKLKWFWSFEIQNKSALCWAWEDKSDQLSHLLGSFFLPINPFHKLQRSKAETLIWN